MPVLMIAQQPNLDEGTYASMLEQLMPLLRSAYYELHAAFTR